jgi:transposase
MPRGTELSEVERQRMLDFQKLGYSIRWIASEVKRSKSVVQSFLASPSTYGISKRPGRPSKLTDRQERLLLREASKGKKSARQLKNALNLPLHLSSVQRLLKKASHLEYKKRLAAPLLTRSHINARLLWAQDKINYGDLWNTVVFSDEKKWNLDGPDGLQYYWHDTRKEEEYYKNRQSGGGSVMVWAAFLANGKSDIGFLDGTQNSTAYCATLRKYLLPFLAANHPDGHIFQQDNAPIHTSRETKRAILELGLNVMAWPSKSPDLNPIENLWGVLARAVYNEGRQFDTKEELKSAIIRGWATVTSDLMNALVQSMPNRCQQVIERKGAYTTY